MLTDLSETGVGSISAYGKILLVDAATNANGLGFAVTPLVEISPGSQDEIGWALPVNVEKTARRPSDLRFNGVFLAWFGFRHDRCGYAARITPVDQWKLWSVVCSRRDKPKLVRRLARLS